MPLYEFECRECKENFDKLVRIVGVQEVMCPRCGSSRTQKKISVFATHSGVKNTRSGGDGSNCAPGGT